MKCVEQLGTMQIPPMKCLITRPLSCENWKLLGKEASNIEMGLIEALE
jgi:hypothetical protein